MAAVSEARIAAGAEAGFGKGPDDRWELAADSVADAVSIEGADVHPAANKQSDRIAVASTARSR